jgi:hypothetical protein
VLLVERASDVLTLDWLGVRVVGRPSWHGGVAELTMLLREVPANTPLFVVGERDAKANGHWPGRDGARATAAALEYDLGRPVAWVLSPAPHKDARAWFHAHQDQFPVDKLGEHYLAGLELPLPDAAVAAAEPAAPAPAVEAPVVPCFAQLQNEPLDWLWRFWLARGMPALVDGDPGLGKSTLLADLVARLTTGRPMPDEPATITRPPLPD